MEVKAYPVWRISARWNQKDYQNNCTGMTFSFRRNYSIKTMNRWAEKWWDKYKSRRLKDKEPIELLGLEVTFEGKEIWYLIWFNHKSLNYFPDEDSAFESFRNWLDKKGYRYGNYSNDEIGLTSDFNDKKVCLMGAEQTWRWKYCGCKVCKRLGITIIKH